MLILLIVNTFSLRCSASACCKLTAFLEHKHFPNGVVMKARRNCSLVRPYITGLTAAFTNIRYLAMNHKVWYKPFTWNRRILWANFCLHLNIVTSTYLVLHSCAVIPVHQTIPVENERSKRQPAYHERHYNDEHHLGHFLLVTHTLGLQSSQYQLFISFQLK